MNYLATCGYVIQSGRGFVKDDYKNYNKVALIDDNAAQNLFPSQNPVGQTVEINQEPYTIVGVIRQDENYQPTINSIDEYYTYYQSIVGSVMIPDSCWPISFKFDVPQNVIVKADSTDTMSSVGNAAADLDCKYFSSCRRYWCHEYHVGFCYRAYQRDWIEKGYRGT